MPGLQAGLGGKRRTFSAERVSSALARSVPICVGSARGRRGAVSNADGNARTPGGVRPLLADAIREEISPEYLRELVAQVKTMTKKTFVYCPDCRYKVQVEVPDLPRVIAGLTELLEQAEGKPGTVSTEDAGVTLIVERLWPPRKPEPPPESPEAE
jgi:hypothetical protein